MNSTSEPQEGERPGDRHLDDLRKSLLSDETNALCQFATWGDAAKIGKSLNWNGAAKKLGACLHLPYFALSGELITSFARFKPLPENRPVLKGQQAKYLSPKGGGTRLYFPPRSRAGRLQDRAMPIIIVEGEKKAALLDQLGYAVIGLCGVSCWSAPRVKGEDGKKIGKRELHPDFAGIHLGTPVAPGEEPGIISPDIAVAEPEDRRDVFICFDADIGCKPGVAWEEFRLAETLEAAGARIRCIRIPDDPDSDKTGIDDYLSEIQKRGGNPADAVEDLIGNANKPKPPKFGLMNYQTIKITDEKGKEKNIDTGLPAKMISADLTRQTRAWPRRVNNSLFARDEDRGPRWLTSPNTLFAWLQKSLPATFADFAPVHWGEGNGFITKPEFAEYLKLDALDYESVDAAPHEPPIIGHYYIHPPIKGGNGKALAKLLKRFAPATDEDEWLIVAFLLTLVWGGPYGQRPAFLFTGTDGDTEMGRGIGKTTMVRLCSKLVGGTFDIRPGDKWDEVAKRLLSDTACSTTRVVLIDNIKTSCFSWSDVEALITAERINGRKLYVGDGSRPNTFSICLTMNGATVSKDIAQRSVTIKLNRPAYSGNWETDTAAYIDNHRWEIVGDLIAHLKRPLRTLDSFSRWGAWERDIIGRLPEPGKLQTLIQERRGEIDDDHEEATLIRETIREELRIRGHGNPDEAGVRIPAGEMALILCSALNEKLSATAAGTKLKAIAGAIPELRKTKYHGVSTWFWCGKDHSGETEKLRDRPIRSWG